MSYAALEKHYRRISRLRHLEAIASWDEATVMPVGGGEARAAALSMVRSLVHQEVTRPEVGEWLAAAKNERNALGPWQQTNLAEIEREFIRASALPSELVEACSRAESASEQAWRELRPKNDFAGWLPFFREVVRLKRETATILGERLSLSPYDALLDGFEPGGRTALVRPLFARLLAFLPGFIARVVERQAGETAEACPGPFPVEQQRALGLELMRRLGFDFAHGRLDVSHHPFCGGVPEDTRITTRFATGDFLSSMMSVLHETGHARYEQHLPLVWRGQPVGLARSSSIHESQSLFVEMQVARGMPFIEFVAPLIAQAFPESAAKQPSAFTPANLHRLGTRVRPSLIRVDADEATYPCHVILRFELEQRLIDGSLDPADVPDAWDKFMRELLGLSTRGNDRDGCMQDVHWPAGLIGYFPTYTLGALTAAQLYQSANAAIGDLEGQLRCGDLSSLDAWLSEHVWSQASLLDTPALVAHATGAPLSTQAFERHLERRYGAGG
jgi:carboxypeptidase Taq